MMMNGVLGDRRLYLLLTRSMCRRKPIDTLRAALEGGVDLVQVREKPFGPDAIEWIEKVIVECDTIHVPVIVNDWVDLATTARAHGVHYGQEDLAQQGRPTRSDLIFGVSTHNVDEIQVALATEPDYVAVGPCFPSRTKRFARYLSPEDLGPLVDLATVPCFAIGGITADNVGELTDSGVRRVAVSASVLAAADPAAATTAVRAALDPMWAG
ncbi:MAG: thiamine phosphate synthase [Planctomycetes bacterium]|jgi:thiamine-phosphate pyrophosphorylase|nr:thiamine phosphate synthase [Planctomycetota bacterium]